MIFDHIELNSSFALWNFLGHKTKKINIFQVKKSKNFKSQDSKNYFELLKTTLQKSSLVKIREFGSEKMIVSSLFYSKKQNRHL